MSVGRTIANGEDAGVGCSSHPSTSAPCEGAKGDGDAVHRDDLGDAAERPSELLFMAQARLSEGNTVGGLRAGSYNTVPLRVRTGRREVLEEATAGLIYRGVQVCGVASCLWAGSLMILYAMKGVGATMLSLIPTAYPVSCAAAWILCFFFGKSSSSTSSVILIVHQLALLSLPALVQINMGGMERSGCVVLWALVAPFSALVMNERRQACLGFACFVIEITILVSLEHASVGLEPLAFIDTKELPVTNVQRTLFSIGNIVGVASIAFLLVERFQSQLMRSKKANNSLLNSILPPLVVDDLLKNMIRDHGDTSIVSRRQGVMGYFRQWWVDGSSRVRDSPLTSSSDDGSSVHSSPESSVPVTPDSDTEMNLSIGKVLRGRLGVEAREVKDATIVFIDVVGFTEYTTAMPPRLLFQFLDKVFSRIDAIAKKYGITKVRTIGDGYLAVSGLMSAFGYPEDSRGHAIKALLFSVETHHAFSTQLSAKPVRLRIGCASGSVLTGVLGATQPQFDIVGPVANLAARLEATATDEAVHVSNETRELVERSIPGKFVFNDVRKVECKGFGLCDTYDAPLEANIKCLQEFAIDMPASLEEQKLSHHVPSYVMSPYSRKVDFDGYGSPRGSFSG